MFAVCRRLGQLLCCCFCDKEPEDPELGGSSRSTSSWELEPSGGRVFSPLAGPGSILLPLPMIYHLRPATPPAPSGPPPNRPLPPLPTELDSHQLESSQSNLNSTISRQPAALQGLHTSLAGSSFSTGTNLTVLILDEMEGHPNQLLSNVKSSDLSLHAQVHPVIIIEISDHIARHTQRKQDGPVVGGIIGQQNGREIILEQAFEAHTTVGENGGLIIPGDFLATRIEQLKLVHKDRNLDLVGWYTLMPLSGPQPHLLPIHNQILSFNDSAVVLGFHTSMLVDQPKDTPGGKLPITIYESNYEVDDAGKAVSSNDEDKEMKDGDAALKLKFREIPFTPDTFEAEMISLNFVAGGGGNAASTEVKDKKPAAAELDVKGKRRAVPQDVESIPTPDTVVLSKEEEEAVAALISKQNAAKMMKSRIDVTAAYLEQLPPSVLNGEEITVNPNNQETGVSYTVLREVQSLTDRLNLVEPSNAEQFNKEVISEANDVRSIAMLDEMAASISEARDVGKKHNVVEAAKNQGRRMAAEYTAGGGGSGYNVSGAGDLL